MHSDRGSCVEYLDASSDGTTNSLSPEHHLAHGDPDGGRLTHTYVLLVKIYIRCNTEVT